LGYNFKERKPISLLLAPGLTNSLGDLKKYIVGDSGLSELKEVKNILPLDKNFPKPLEESRTYSEIASILRIQNVGYQLMGELFKVGRYEDVIRIYEESPFVNLLLFERMNWLYLRSLSKLGRDADCVDVVKLRANYNFTLHQTCVKLLMDGVIQNIKDHYSSSSPIGLKNQMKSNEGCSNQIYDKYGAHIGIPLEFYQDDGGFKKEKQGVIQDIISLYPYFTKSINSLLPHYCLVLDSPQATCALLSSHIKIYDELVVSQLATCLTHALVSDSMVGRRKIYSLAAIQFNLLFQPTTHAEFHFYSNKLHLLISAFRGAVKFGDLKTFQTACTHLKFLIENRNMVRDGNVLSNLTNEEVATILECNHIENEI